MIRKFYGEDFVELARSLNDILKTGWPFLSKITSGLEKPEPTLTESRGEGKFRDLDSNDSNPCDKSGLDSGILSKKPQNNYGIHVWDSANEYVFSVIRLITTGAARIVLLKFEQKMADQVMVDRHGLL